jgi:hypothetical protein
MNPSDDRYRRGLYTFWRRSAPYPSFMALDAPTREFCSVKRIRTNTPLQALVTLNDPAFVEAAKALAKRMMTEAGEGLEERVALGFRWCVARRPAPDEVKRLGALYQQQLERYRKDEASAKKLAGSPEHAAWTVVANVLLNLDETLTKE